MLNINCSYILSINQFRCLLCSRKLLTFNQSCRMKHKHQTVIKQSYRILGLTEDCEDEALRLAFVHLAKQYHPDSGSTTANATKFAEVESAYRTIQSERNAKRDTNCNLPDVEEFDIKHTAPQHRHFLAYDTGVGTPSERQRRFTVERAQKAVDNLMEHRMNKIHAAERNTLVGMDKTRARDIKTKYGVDRLVEDLIQEAMNKGEFKDLPGLGKPLDDRTTSQNPYVDFVTHKMNQILIDNGFTPEWIQLSKEIREETRDLEDNLAEARNAMSDDEWEKILEKSREIVDRINKKINKYNLLVPILQKQMLQIDLQKLGEKIRTKAPSMKPKKIKIKSNRPNVTAGDETFGFFNFILASFEKKKS